MQGYLYPFGRKKKNKKLKLADKLEMLLFCKICFIIDKLFLVVVDGI
jgi:hypothetical protein